MQIEEDPTKTDADAHVKEVLATMHAAIIGQREGPDRVIIEQISNALQSDGDGDADVLADNQVIDTRQFGDLCPVLGMLNGGGNLMERHPDRDVVHDQFISHRIVDGDVVHLIIIGILNKQLHGVCLLHGLRLRLLEDRNSSICVIILIININQHLVVTEEDVANDHIDDSGRQGEMDRVLGRIDIIMQRIDYTGLILEEVILVLSRQRLVLGPGLVVLPPIVGAIVLWGKRCIVILDVTARLSLARTAGLDDNFVPTKIDIEQASDSLVAVPVRVAYL